MYVCMYKVAAGPRGGPALGALRMLHGNREIRLCAGVLVGPARPLTAPPAACMLAGPRGGPALGAFKLRFVGAWCCRAGPRGPGPRGLLIW